MEHKLADMKPSKNDINMVIMDYLISEGYPAAAEKFAEETNLVQNNAADLKRSINERVKIRGAIYTGKMDEAIHMINELDAEILDQNRTLHFQLLQLQLIEIIRAVLDSSANPNAVEFRPALDFATQQLAPHAPTDPKHLKDLEKTMALMIFKPDKMGPEMKELLDPRLREKVAADVNKAILASQGRAPEARIKQLVRARAWAEAQAREAQIPMPEKISIGLDGENAADEDEAMS
ncbi:hypothetical protein AMS68_005081 [Peltaster fructicola]|uniref:CTLH domain-containing protein n=1 Tax=Peltaster fructicola TaxID=286661 RepID=A0A6H0XXV6_9PEZI|nr:hypothetical protein AMS68_005081 [Peltaster fructicola]